MGKWILILDLIIVHGLLGFVVYKSFFTQARVADVEFLEKLSIQPTSGAATKSSEDYKVYVDQKLATLAAVLRFTPAPTAKIGTVSLPTKSKTRTTSYVTLVGSGSTNMTSWVDASGSEFYFDTKDYPGLVEVYFEANMKLVNGSGMAYVRLFDTTNGIGVQGSDVQTKNGTDTIITSGKVNFWAGRNLIKVQLRSLTAESAVYNSGRLRIVSEN